MLKRMCGIGSVIVLLTAGSIVWAEEPLHVVGPTTPINGLPVVEGVKHVEVFHASPDGWTYNHHVDMAAWKGRLYVGWDSCERDEDVGVSRELYATSGDGVTWSGPALLFPQGVSTAMRMYFFVAPSAGRMLAIAGSRTSRDTVAEARKGGLVVREVRADHSLGEVYTLRGAGDAAAGHAPPVYTSAPDRGFVASCEELLNNRPFLEQQDYGRLLGERRMKWHDVSQWPADEPSRAHFPNRFGKGMSFFHRRDGALVGVMKWGWVTVSRDEGETWSQPVRPATLVAGMAKTWGQRAGHGRYVLLYNPDLEKRFPLVMVHGDDGVTFGDMRVVRGDVPPIRHPGLYKVEGPQYVRGISEWSTDGSWKDDGIWVAYSMGKEDIWVSRIPPP
jgi:hypothetical protein